MFSSLFGLCWLVSQVWFINMRRITDPSTLCHNTLAPARLPLWLSPGELGNFRAPRDVDQLKENAQ